MMIETNSPEETYAFGKKLGMEAQAGQVYCLNGDLGVGKTVFTQGFVWDSGRTLYYGIVLCRNLLLFNCF